MFVMRWKNPIWLSIYVRFDVFAAVTMKNTVFWDVALVRTNVSEECVASIIRVTRISELGTTLAVTSNLSMQRASVASYF
jgi:hypothetical protein